MALPANVTQSEVFAFAHVAYKTNIDAGTLGTNQGNGGPTPVTPPALPANATRSEIVAQNVVADLYAQQGVNR
jgi:hypothetical protein